MNELTIDELKDFLQNASHKYKTAQTGVCFAIIRRMHKRLRLGYRFKNIRVCKYRNMVVDGNHTYIAYSLAGIEVQLWEGTSAPSSEVRDYKTIEIDEVCDWDDETEEGRIKKSDNYLSELTKIIEVK